MKPPDRFTIQAQPDNTTCGAACLHGIYNYYNDSADLATLAKEVRSLKEGGTLASMLATHALKRGYRADLYTSNLHVFDPTWAKLSRKKLVEKLAQSFAVRKNSKLRLAIKSHLEFLSLGGNIHFDELSPDLIKGFLKKKTPVLAGLSSTWLYQAKREYGFDCTDDDILGEPCGHFVVLYDYKTRENCVKIADPWKKNPFGKSHYYDAPMQRLLNSILLGVLTYDANLLVLSPSLSKASSKVLTAPKKSVYG
jgi:hypothetical protein